MRFAVLGPLDVLRDDHAPVSVPGAKERLILAILTASAPGVVTVDRLLESVWDGTPPVTARKSLQAHIVRLRSALEPERPKGSSGRYVVRRGPGYALAVERGAIDALQVGDLVARGRALLASGDPSGALGQLTAALDLWRGEPYADWPDAPFAETERRRLVEVRAAAVEGLLEAKLALGQHTEVVPELERLVLEEPLREGWWSLLMLALYRGGRQADALAAGRRVRAVLADELGADPGPGVRAVETAILTQDPALDLPRQRAGPPSEPGAGVPSEAVGGGPATGACPYKGLAAYQVEDAALFHGRARLVSTLVGRLVDVPLLVVSGPSGAGKSSVVRAGLVPALADGALPGSGSWRPIVLTPGRRPVDTLADLTGEAPPDEPVVLVCDQFEELWAPGTDPAERTAFLDTVLGLVDDGVVVRCVAVVRGDHVGRLAEHVGLSERLGGAIVLVPPLTDPELRDVVNGPARSAGLSVEPELLDAVVVDVLGQAGALPLLSTALVGTWDRRRGDLLTLAGYLEAGGVAGALTRTAEAAYAALDEEGQRLARRLLVRLADSDSSGVLVRRVVPLGELDLEGEHGPARRAVVETFVRRRLLAVDGDRLEVAHEALLTSWPRLARWLEDDAAGRAVRRQLAPAALDWQRDDRPADGLYRGTRLGAAVDWAAGAGANPTPLEQEFLDASRAQADAELRSARQRVRRTRRLAAGLAVVLVLALLAAGLAVGFQQRAQEHAAEADAATTVAEANRLAALSTTVGSLDLSLLLAAEAVNTQDTPATQDGLLASIIEHRRAVRIAPLGGHASDTTLADGGRTLFVTLSGQPASVVAWQVGAATAPRTVIKGFPDDIDGSPTEDLVAAAYMNDGPKVEVRAADGTTRLVLEGADPGTTLGGWPLDVAFTPDGRRLRLVLGTDAGDGWRLTVRELDLASRDWRTIVVAAEFPFDSGPEAGFADDASAVVAWADGAGLTATAVDLRDGSRTQLRLARRTATTQAFVALPSGAAQLWDDGGVTLYDRAGREAQTLDGHEEAVRDVLVAATGSWAATAGQDGGVVLWDVDRSTGRWSRRETLTGHTGQVAGVELDRTGRTLLTVDSGGSVIAWDVTVDAGFGSSYPGLGDRWISNRPQLVGHGNLLVAPTRPVTRSGGGGPFLAPANDTLDVAVTFLDAATGRVVAEVPVGTTVENSLFGSSVAVSPDGRRVAVTSGFATTVVDTRTREVLGKVMLPPTGEDDLPAEIVWGAGWTRDGARLLLGSAVDGLVVVNPENWQIERRVALGGAVQTIEPSPDGRLLAVADIDGPQVWLLDAATLDVRRTARLAQSERAFDLSFSRDGRWLAAGGNAGQVSVFDTATWRLAKEPVQVDGAFVQQVEWLPDGRTVVASGGDGAVSLYDVRRGLVRARRLPASSDRGQGYTHLVLGASDELVVLAGDRAGHRYPMKPARWLAEACAIVGRDLTRAEWDRYLPDRPYRKTCTPLL